MQLPFLKAKKMPRIAKPMEEKSIGLSAEDKMEEYLIEELFEAAEKKNVTEFRQAFEALLMNCFEEEEEGEYDDAS